MNKLETSIGIVLQQQKHIIAAATWESRKRYYNRMLRLAHSMGINEACQELYSAYITDNKGSKERRTLHIHCVKLLDAVVGTRAKDENGKLYNEQSMPTKEETQRYFQNMQYPIVNKASIDSLIVKAEIEMQYLNLSESTIGQYRHAWMAIRRYFQKHNSIDYDEKILQCFIREIGYHRFDGSMKEWKWKINRKAANVLIEVANTGQFHWTLIKPSILCATMEIQSIRDHYISTVKHRNLSKSTIYLHDYVFRKFMAFLEINTANDLFHLSPKNVQGAIISFAGICNRRSIATILPIVRSLLTFIYESGYVQRDLSGIVINGFVQRGSVAGYITMEEEALLIFSIEKEPKRTKAIILLALKLGLRDCDICNLTFGELDWCNDKIILIQKKTASPVVLPMLPDIGNALMEYILYERPKRDDKYPYIFLRKQAPFNKIVSAYSTCSRLLKKLAIKPVNSHATGTHILRYTMVHRLLAVKTPHQVITDTLGHTSKESDKPYLSMEESMLRLCALDLSVIGKVSWKGGTK